MYCVDEAYSKVIHPASPAAAERKGGFLYNKLLVAMPFIADMRFHQSIIYVCSHDHTGALGLIVNKILPGLTYQELLKQLNISNHMEPDNVLLHYGGPHDVGRGFVLHTPEYQANSSVSISENYSITATLDILKHLALSQGPKNYVLALGYILWESGQLESEIQENFWLTANPEYDLVFSKHPENAWHNAMGSMGVDPTDLSIHAGHA